MIAALVALIVLLMLGGSSGSGWTADLEKAVKKQVPDHDRREAVLNTLDDYREEVEKVGESLQGHFVELLDLHLDYSSAKEDFDAVTAKLKEDQAHIFKQDLKMRSRMKTEMSREEWNAVFTKSE